MATVMQRMRTEREIAWYGYEKANKRANQRYEEESATINERYAGRTLMGESLDEIDPRYDGLLHPVNE